MKPSHDQHSDFLAHQALPGFTFEHNDPVEVISGGHAGDFGAIVSVERLGDDPAYLVELGSGQDAVISQSRLRLVEA